MVIYYFPAFSSTEAICLAFLLMFFFSSFYVIFFHVSLVTGSFTENKNMDFMWNLSESCVYGSVLKQKKETYYLPILGLHDELTETVTSDETSLDLVLKYQKVETF